MQAPFADPLVWPRQLFRIALPLAGRNPEMQIIYLLLETVAYLICPWGHDALTISGEMGIGKTRLLAELFLAARERGFLILQASAYKSGRMFPYFPFIEALRSILRSSTPEQLRRYVGLSPLPMPSAILLNTAQT